MKGRGGKKAKPEMEKARFSKREAGRKNTPA